MCRRGRDGHAPQEPGSSFMKSAPKIAAICCCLSVIALSQNASGVTFSDCIHSETMVGTWFDVQTTTPEIGQGYTGEQSPSQLGSSGMDIVIRPGATLAANTAALDAFNRAAVQWEMYVLDPITVYIDADLEDMQSTSIIGGANTVVLFDPYTPLRDAVAADAANEPDDDIVAALPATDGDIEFLVPPGNQYAWEGNISAAKANYKALGVTGLDARFGETDATITFNSGFAFDYDNRDGVDPNTIDFESVAVHELGHALGFLSEVDYIDRHLGGVGENRDPSAPTPTVLDLFRFRDDSAGHDPETAAEFTAFPRDLIPGENHTFDQIDETWGLEAEIPLSTGKETGDERQASHWQDDVLAQAYFGTMDPTLNYQSVRPVTLNDLRALDLIGYDVIPIPEPCSTILAVAAMAAALAMPRRRRR